MNTRNKVRIPNNLKECRLRAGLTQFEVMQKLGLKSMDRISKWENGMKFPNAVNILRLMKVYSVSAAELYPEVYASDDWL